MVINSRKYPSWISLQACLFTEGKFASLFLHNNIIRCSQDQACVALNSNVQASIYTGNVGIYIYTGSFGNACKSMVLSQVKWTDLPILTVQAHIYRVKKPHTWF